MRSRGRPFPRPRGLKICTNLRKRCRDRAGANRHTVEVDQSVIDQVERLRPAIKREWGALLRTEPTLSPLGHPDTLAYLMDETLAQVIKGVHAHSVKSWIRRSPALLAPLQRHCACGLNPLLNYYATGELALHAVLREKLDAIACDVWLTVFHLKAQQEIETLCAVCQVRGGPNCRSTNEPSAASDR